MGAIEEDIIAGDGVSQNTLQVPMQKKRKVKSPTPGTVRGRSATPIRGRESTPFSGYLTRRSATPVTFRSITPFIQREEKEKTPFELGHDIKTQITCNMAVFDKALVMDITESEDAQKPVRYITSDLSVIDRACVMDISNVEVIYVVEEYEEEFEEEEAEEPAEEAKSKRKSSKSKRGKSKRSIDKDQSPSGNASEGEDFIEPSVEREDSADLEGADEHAKKGKKKGGSKKKDKKDKEHSPSPKLTLKLEIGGGSKMNKKMFEQQSQAAKPPTKKSKLAIQAEEKAKAAAAAKAAEEEAKRLKAEQEEKARREAELRAQQEAEEAARLAEEEEEENQWNDEYGEEGYDGDRSNREATEEHTEPIEEIPAEPEEELEVWEDHVWSDPDDEEFWAEMAKREGVAFMHHIRNYAIAKRLSRQTRDEDWFRRREDAQWPRFVVFLSDRSIPSGQNLRLACAADGPELMVQWFRDGRRLKDDDNHRIDSIDNIMSLELINPNEMHSGEYKCVVWNRNDEISTTCIVTVYEVYKREPKPPNVQFVREYYHLRDDALTLECHVAGVPRPKVTWLRGRFQIVQNKTYTLIEEAHGVCKLLIFRPTSKDSDVYTCKAENDSGAAQVNHNLEIKRNLHFHMEEKEKLRLRRIQESQAEMEAFYKAQRTSPEPVVSPKRKLKFATQLRDRMALVGSTVKFACTIIGPSPMCVWMKDDAPISYGDHIRNLSEEGKAILELSKVMPDSSGFYKCIAKNQYCEIETSCYFRVYSAQAGGDEQEPRFALPLRDIYHVTRNDLTITTRVRGNPRPTITWLKDDIPIVIDERIVQIEHLDGQCELIINEPTLDEAGIYTCLAENKLGSVKISHEVVLDDYPELQPGIPKPKKEGEEAGETAEPQPVAEVKADLPPTGEAPPEGEEPKQEEEEYVYERRYKTPDPTPMKQQLNFIANPSNRFVTEGSKVKLQAVVDGPNPAIRWKKNDESISYSSRVRNMSKDSLAILEFTNVVPEDDGVYTIIASNEFSRIESSCTLQVLQPASTDVDVEPVFVRSLKDAYHLVANVLKLETGIHGQPLPTVQWYKDDVLIENGGRYEIEQHLDGTCELTVSRPDQDDSGKYVVKAENRAGKAEVCHLVLFEGIETHIAENIHGVFHADKSLLRQKPEEDEEDTYPPPPEPYAAPSMPPLPPTDPPKEETKADQTDAAGEAGAAPGEAEAEVPPTEEESTAVEIPTETERFKKREKIIPIHFETTLKDRYAAEGSKVKFSCILEGKQPLVKWFRGEEQLMNSSRVKYRNVEGLLTLEISNLTLEDSAEYMCYARDETGQVSSTAMLKVYELPAGEDVPPTFTRNIRETYHPKMNELQLDTHVRGPPTPTIAWIRDGVRIKPNGKFEQIDHDDGTCELSINHPCPQDSGTYVCKAENKEGTTQISHKVIIETQHERPKSPMLEHLEKEMADLAMTVAAATAAGVTPSEDAVVEGEAPAEPTEAPKEEDPYSSYGSRREVPAPPDHKKFIYLRNYLTNRTVKEGGSVKWMVYIDGPDSTARWYRGEDPIPFSQNIKMVCQDGIAWMSIATVSKDDAGEYTLKVRGAENEIESSCTLTVYSASEEEKIVPPTFTVGINDLYSLTENQLVLDCRVRGKPRPNIQWRKDNAIIRASQKYEQVDQPDGYSKLVIKNPTANDSGVYTCVARNEAAENSISHQVNFEGGEVVATEKIHGFFHRDVNKPRFVGPLGNQTVCAGGTIIIMAEFMPSSTPIEVQWFRDHQLLVSQPDVKIFRDKGLYVLALMNASRLEEGTYACAATNEYGTTEAHASVDVATDAGDDEKPPLFRVRPSEKMTIQLGDPFSISFNIADEPRPKLTFFRGTTDITKDERVTKEKDISDDSMRFTVQQSQISDCGIYFVVARNKFGTDRIFVTITVKTPKKEDDETA